MKKHLIVLACFGSGLAAPVSAAPVISFTGGLATTEFPGRTLGFEFTVGADPFEVTSLGFYDFGDDGLIESHEVGIFTSAGTLVVSAVVGAGTSASLDGGFRYVSIAPVFLAANTSYLAGAYTGSNDDPVVRFATATTDPAITLGSTRFDLTGTAPGLTAPLGTQGTTFDDGYFGVNFNGSTAAVPEPATWAFMIIGFGGIGYSLRSARRHKFKPATA